MAKEKKFGTFPGVFTPSILTILGVIMYMRLSWVVGQSGILGSLAIILIAHIISITTGLSISSIATDKKIKAGGIYYILSRSLGLPMGGAIGVALFIGTALSISMYIVGFAENFLSIPQISEFLNLAPGVQSYRIVGTVVIISLVILAFISTSLAIKSQYFILGSIVLSIISITVGFATHPEFMPASPVLFGVEGGESIEKVFAIFFPAVTGFTAGVAMSGDLRDPKKNIPAGTLWAIAVGFVIYIALALGFGFFVNRNDLLNDNNLSMHIAWIPALVVAGIWGATLSSALGGILGGPRILQALSKDSVAPKIFAKGYGATNEPRNALIMIFIIAEAGIMIGNLNIIAGVVTMFYLTSYGFINLAYVLENWASTDFRPTFKVSRIFGIVGFIFAFAIMFKLDVVSMLVAFVLIGIIYFVLQRKQLKLDFGDVWQSVWMSVVRKGLHVLDNNSIEDRNWQPNIILFSGANEKRAHLLEFGKSLVGKFGFLSNFDLTVDTETDVLFPKHKQSIPIKQNQEIAVFTRRQSCKDIYDGIEMIVRTYGFSGIEPNTLVMGWGRQSKNPTRFVKLIQTINDLDYNTMLIDYDKRVGYGKYKLIDIWWRGAGNNGNFALTLAKFMLASDKWENAKIRLMIVNNEDSKAFYIYRQANEILKNMRIDAEVKIINNEVEKKHFYDIIRIASKEADIVFIGIPAIHKGSENEFVENTNKLLHKIGTVVLLKASSLFKELNLGVNISQKSVISASENIEFTEEMSNELIKSKQKDLNKSVKINFENIAEIYEKTIATYTFREVDVLLFYLDNFQLFINNIFDVLQSNLTKLPIEKRREYIAKYQNAIIKKANKEITVFQNKQIEELKEMMQDILVDYDKNKKEFIGNISENIDLFFDIDEFKIKKEDNFKYRIFKIKNRYFNTVNDKVKLPYKAKNRSNVISSGLNEVLSREIEQIRIETIRFIYNYEDMIRKIISSVNKIKLVVDCDDKILKNITDVANKCNFYLKNLEEETKNIYLKVAQNRKKILLRVFNLFLKNTNKAELFYLNGHKKIKSKTLNSLKANIELKKDLQFTSLELFLNLIMIKNQVTKLNFNIVDLMNNLSEETIKISEKLTQKSIDFNQFFTQLDLLSATTINLIKQLLENMPKSIVIMEQNSLNDSLYKNFESIKTINIPLNQVSNILINEMIIDRLNNMVKNYKQNIEKIKYNREAITDTTNLFIQQIKELNEEVSMFKVYKIIDKVGKIKTTI